MQPLVSVVVPNYNHADFLPERMQSILAQTHRQIEIILLDDASADNSRQVMESFRSLSQVAHIFFNDENSGSGYKQWQKGFAACTGEWVWVAESDDWCEPSFLRSLLEHVTPQCNLAFAQSMVVEDNKVLWSSRRSSLYGIIDGKQFIEKEMINGNAVFNASMAIFRRSALSKINFDFSALLFLGDWAFWAGIASSGDVLICGKVLNYFRQNSGGISAGAKNGGGLYAQYPQLLNLMVTQGWILQTESQPALNSMFLRLLSDTAVNRTEKQKLEKQYKSLVPVLNLKQRWWWCRFKRCVTQTIKD